MVPIYEIEAIYRTALNRSGSPHADNISIKAIEGLMLPPSKGGGAPKVGITLIYTNILMQVRLHRNFFGYESLEEIQSVAKGDAVEFLAKIRKMYIERGASKDDLKGEMDMKKNNSALFSPDEEEKIADIKAKANEDIAKKREEREKEMLIARLNKEAEEYGMFYQALLNTGFSEEQAMQILLKKI